MNKIIDFQIGKVIDVFGFLLNGKGFQEIITKKEKILRLQKIIIGDDTLNKVEVTLWEPFGSPDNNYIYWDLIVIKNCKVKEFNGKKQLSTIESTEIKNSLDSKNDLRLKKFYKEHADEKQYEDVKGEIVSFREIKSTADFAFILDVQETFKNNIENKDRPLFEINGTVTKINHSEKNFTPDVLNVLKK